MHGHIALVTLYGPMSVSLSVTSRLLIETGEDIEMFLRRPRLAKKA